MSRRYTDNGRRARKRILWGLLLIAAGCLFLLHRMNIVYFETIWHFWPALFALSGLVDILSASRLKHVTRGFFKMAVGFWLYASIENLWGWTFSASWPILVIAFGIVVTVNGLSDHVRKSEKELDHEAA